LAGTLFVHNHSEVLPIHWNAAEYLHNCAFIFFNNISIIIDADINGILSVNIMMKTKIMHLTVQINKVKNSRLFTNAILVYYYDALHA